MHLGELIKAYREKNHLSMQAFADMALLSKGYISMLEKNQHPQSHRKLAPSLDTCQKIASAMNLTLDELIAALHDSQPIQLEHFSEKEALSQTEQRLLAYVQLLNQSGQELLLSYADTLAASGKYKGDIDSDQPR